MRNILIIILALFLTSCAPAATEPAAAATEVFEAPAATEPPAATELPFVPEVLSSPTLVAASSATIPAPTSGPTETETALPTLELPTALANPPALVAWDGEPTYGGDSKAGYFFRVMYNPDVWALTTDNYGFPALGHRSIEYCVIAPSVGRGLPPSVTVDHDFRKVGVLDFEVSTAYSNGVPQFATYIGGDTNIYTGFEVSFNAQAGVCIQDAEVVIGTLTSVLISQATPIP